MKMFEILLILDQEACCILRLWMPEIPLLHIFTYTSYTETHSNPISLKLKMVNQPQIGI